MRTLPIAIAVALTLAAGGAGLIQLAAEPAQTARTPSVETPRARPRTVALGRLEPVSELVRVNGPAGQDAARLSEVRVAEGDWVEKGQIIALLDTRERFASNVAQAEATLDLRRAALARTRADLDSQAAVLAASVDQQRAQRDRARWDFERLQSLQRSGLYRDSVLTDKRLALDSAEHVLRSAELSLARNRLRNADGLRLEEASAQAEVAAANAALARARADLAMVEIRAPISGRILRRVSRAGEQIAQDGIAEIGNTRVMMARLEVFEADIAAVVVGQPVRLMTRAFEGHFDGRVERIGLKVNRQSVIGDDPATALDARVVEVLVRLDAAASERLGGFTGLQVRATLEVGAGS